MTADVELLPCPFCGHVPQDWPDFLHQTGGGWRDDSRGDGTTFRHYMRDNDPRGVHGKCWELGCLTHEGGCGATVVGDSRDEAIAAWNRRATAAQDAEIEALRAEVGEWKAIATWEKEQHDRLFKEARALNERAERLAEALIAWHKQATDKGRREREESPGHSHAVLGVWDSDNGKYAGVDCAQCALWFEATRLRAALNPTAAQENDDA